MYGNDYWQEVWADNAEYNMAYDTIRYAMRLVLEYEGESNLDILKNLLHKASSFVNDELDELPDQTQELGLDKWQQEELERRQEEEGWEREQREQEEWEQEREEEEDKAEGTVAS